MKCFVLDEASYRWMIKFENDLIRTLWRKALKHSPIDGKYLNDKSTVNSNDYVVKFYEPLRILLYTNEKCSCTINRLEVENDGIIHHFNSP